MKNPGERAGEESSVGTVSGTDTASSAETAGAIKQGIVIFLSTAAAALTVSLWLFADDTTSLTAENEVALRQRWMAIGISIATGVFVEVAVFFGGRAERRKERLVLAGKLTAPLILSPFVPALYTREAWENREAGYLCYLLLLALLLEKLLAPAVSSAKTLLSQRGIGQRLLSFSQGRVWRRISFWVAAASALALIAVYCARVGVLTNVSHLKMATMSSDLAEFDNLFFNALHGHPFRAPAIEGDLENWSALKVHAEFGLWMLLPFYAIAPGPEALLWIQTAVVALTAVPVFLLGRSSVGPWGGVVFSAAYLAMPAVQRPNFYDFHFTPLGMFFVAWLLYFTFELSREPTRRGIRVATYVAFVLALISREDISLGLVALGVFLMLQGKLVRLGLQFALVSAGYFALMKFVIMPQFGEMWFHTIYDDLKAQGVKGFSAVFVTLLSNPAHAARSLFIEPKFLYLLHMTVPLLVLWMRRPLFWFALLPGFVSTLLVTNRPPMFQATFQYTYLWVPYVVAASIVVLGKHRARAPALLALALLATSLDRQLGVLSGGDRIVGGFGLKTFELSEQEQRRIRQLREIVRLIPQEASVAATESEGPHVSTRLVMYSLKFTLGHKPDYLLVGQARIGGEVAHLRRALESGEYGVVATRGPFVLAKRGADTSENKVLWSRAGVRARR
jgi:uncharacterized membrane protein